MKTLIVEDNAEDRKILMYNLERHGCEIIEAVDGQDGLKKAIIHKPELIISDALMPNMDGFQLLRAVKKNDALRNVPFIFYSAIYTGYREEELALSLGAEAFMVKPKEPDAFWAELTAVLDQCRLKKREPREGRINDEEEEYLRRYTHIVTTKLEEKVRELQEANAKIWSSEQCYRNLFQSMRDVIVMADPDRTVLDVNQPAMRDLFGYETGEVVGKNTRFLYADDESYQFTGREVFNSKGFVDGRLISARFRKKNGEAFTGEVFALKLIDDDGRPSGNIGVIRDITSRKRAETESARLWRVLEASLNEIYIFNPETLRFEYVNAGALRNLGYTSDTIRNMTPVDLKPEFTEASFRALVAPLLRGEKDKLVFQTPHRRADGSVYPAEVNLQLIEHEGRRDFLAIILDLTDRQKLENQLRQAQKMEAVGQLAGGIAHDFNNILTAIIGYGNLLLMKLKGDDPLRAYADQILASSERAASVTHSLLAFSRKQIINPKPVRVNDIITRVGKLLARLIGEDVDLGIRLTGSDSTVIADSGQVEQVLMNLATNARDAMPEGGHLSVETDIAELDQTYITTHGYGALGTYLVISVSDTGVGMDEATRERVFEPFFTTKEVGRGTGLGLSIVYGIVKQHGGYINCYSERGKGTTFKIYLPLLTSGAADRTASAEFAPPKGGTETVLVAEDDKEVRTLVTNILTEFGYTVIEAADGEDAVQQFVDHREAIQLLIIDVIMPRISGKEVYTRIGHIRPGIKALFTSGYTADIVHKKGILEEGTDFITKPIIPQELLLKVREILNR